MYILKGIIIYTMCILLNINESINVNSCPSFVILIKQTLFHYVIQVTPAVIFIRDLGFHCIALECILK